MYNFTASGSVINIVNSNGIHWGPEITYNFGSQPKVEPEPDPDAAIRKTKSIVVVLESKDSVSFIKFNYFIHAIILFHSLFFSSN